MNRIKQAQQWVDGLTAEELKTKLKEAKAKYSNKVKPQAMQLMQNQWPKAQKQVALNRLLLVTIWLEEPPELSG